MWAVVLLGLVGAATAATLLTLRRQRLRWLLGTVPVTPPPAVAPTSGLRRGPLQVWLLRAGFAQPGAVTAFVAATVAAVCAGALLAWAAAAVVETATASVSEIPGGVGEMLVSTLHLVPYLVVLLCGVAPLLLVRRGRRQRVSDVDHDLPLVLELLATSAQAGLSFDAALSRVVEVQPPDRPLTQELRAFQRDLLGGSPRLQALRQLGWRLDVTSLTVFVAAVIQSEQLGASMAETLRTQADDLRARRREQALLLAQALPVKLVFPLLICFLPGIFLSTLGPVLYQMLRVADSVLRPLAP